MPDKMGEISREQLASGLWPSVHRKQTPLWETGENIDFDAAGPHKIQGYSLPMSPTSSGDPIRGMGQVTRANGTPHLYFGDASKLYRWTGTGSIIEEGTGYTGIVDPTSSQRATTWSFKEYGDWMIATNGVDTIQVDKGSNFTDLGGITGNFDTAEIVSVLFEHIIVLNTDNSPYEIRWSSAGNPEIWTPSASNTAGFLAIREARSPIVAAVPLQEALAIYTKESLFLLEYVGSVSFRFRQRHALNGIGAVSKTAVVSVGRMNYGMGSGGIWQTDGNTFRYIDEPAIREYIRDNLSVANQSKVCSYHNEDETKIVWYFPTSDEPDTGVAYNYTSGTWTILGYGRTAAVERNAFNYPYSADNAGAVYQDNDGVDAGGSPLTAFVRTKGMDMGDANVTKYLEGITLGYIGSGEVFFRIGVKTSPEDPEISWFPYQEATNDKYEHLRISGKLIYFEMYSEALSSEWRLQSIELYGKTSDRRP